MAASSQQAGGTGAQTWVIDPAHTSVEFSVRHMMFATVRGHFGKVEGKIRLDEQDPSHSMVEVEIDTASIDTRQQDRDQHLRSADFFDVENHPRMTFKSTQVERVSDNEYRVTGDLTMRGVTREVQLDVTETGRGKDPWGGERIGFSASGKLDRTEYGLKWNQALEAGGVLVSNEVRIQIDAQAVSEASGGEEAAEAEAEAESTRDAA